MKRVIIILGVLALSSCKANKHTCPAYAKIDVEKTSQV